MGLGVLPKSSQASEASHRLLQNLNLYYLHSLGTPSHKINVKANARPIKIPQELAETNIKPVFKNCPITQSTWGCTENKYPRWRWAHSQKSETHGKERHRGRAAETQKED